MRKKLIVGIVIVLLLSTGGWIFSRQQFKKNSDNSKTLYHGTIVIGYTLWPGYLGLYVASDKGYFAQEGLSVEVRKYDGFGDLSKAYQSGEIQGKANLTLDAVQEMYSGLDHRAVVAIDYSNGSDAIIAAAAIKKFEDIRGKKVAFEHGTLEEFFFRYALEQHTMTLDDIIPVNLNPEESVAALIRKEVDVAVAFEPLISPTLTAMNGNKIYSSAQAPGLIVDLLTFRSDFIRQYPETVTAIVRAYFKAIDFWKEHPEETYRVTAARNGVTPEEIAEQLHGINILDIHDNRVMFTFAAGLQSLYGNFKNINKFITRIQHTDGVLNTDDLVDPRFIRALSYEKL